MNHDEAIKVLKDRSEFLKGDYVYSENEGEYIKALDYAIAYMKSARNTGAQETIAWHTRFEARFEKYQREEDDGQRDCMADELFMDMIFHIQKLEKGQSDDSNSQMPE